uniref:protein kinase C n=1 Tax=Meloidogyne javanica TaxID=6303 RepID=A0A915LFJ3_MELJA
MSGFSLQFQSGLVLESFHIEPENLSLRRLKQEAVDFVNKHHPKQRLGDRLADHILLYKHDPRSVNILQLIQSADEISEGCLLEIVISPCPQHERLVVHPHTLYVHSYKTPTFCDFCGELLFGLVKQGLKCQGCGLNYHKRCASKIPNNCSGSRQRRPSAIPLSPRNSVGFQSPIFGSGNISSQALNGLSTTLPPRASFSSASFTETSSVFLQMPRKDRSSSWSGRPLWMEVAEATRIKVPHTFQVHSYKRPTVCQHCKKLLKGLIRQGLQCRDCKYNCHKKCAQHAAKDCAGGLSATSPFNCQLSDRGMQAGSEEKSNQQSSYLRKIKNEPCDESDDGSTEESVLNDEDLTATTTTSANSRLQKPWAQSTPSAPLSSTEKENTSSSKTGKSRQQQKEEQQKTINTMTDLDEDEDLNIAKESANIPLMRVVMSKKQTKRPTTNRALKEGWMVHYTERHSMRKKHFWRLDPKAITMFKDETASSYYKEIPLSEVLEVKIAPGIEEDHTELSRSPTHFFEIRTHTSTYFIVTYPLRLYLSMELTSERSDRFRPV